MQRNLDLDRFKVFFAITVVGLHGHFLSEFFPLLSVFLQNYLFRVAVPFFFMVNGFFFFSVAGDSCSAGKWMKRIVFLYFFWTLVYLYFIFPRSSDEWWFYFLSNVLFGYWHLWYLPATLFSGVLVYFYKELDFRRAALVLVSLYLIGVFIQYLGNYHYFSNSYVDSLMNNVLVYRSFVFFGLPMFGVGYLAARHRICDRFSTKKKIAFLVAGLILLCVEFFQNIYLGVSMDEGFDVLYSVPIVAASVLVLVMSSHRVTGSAFLANASSVIYFVHPLFFILFRKVFSSWGPSLVTMLVIFSSLLIMPLLLSVNKKLRFIL